MRNTIDETDGKISLLAAIAAVMSGKVVNSCRQIGALMKRCSMALVLCAAIFGAVSDSGQPLVRIPERSLAAPPVIIAFGDMRFTDPANITAVNPKVRRWLVARIADEKPDTVLLSGDVPWNGDV